MTIGSGLRIGAAEALAAGGLGAAASIPISLSSNQGLLQTIVNAILAGGGASAGAMAGGGMASTSPLAGALVGGTIGGSLGQVGGNILVDDRNEYAIGNLAGLADLRGAANEGTMIQNELYANALKQAVDGLSDAKREKFMAEYEAAKEVARAKMNAVREPIADSLSQEEAAKTEAIVRSIIGNPSYVIA